MISKLASDSLATGGSPQDLTKDGAVPVYVTNEDHGQSSSSSSSGSSVGDIGVPLDPDFGLGQGLPGLASNLTTMLGNMAFAPLMGQLSAISEANPIKGGHGLLGILGAQNIAAGRSPLLGNPMPASNPATPFTFGPTGPTGPFGPPPGPIAPQQPVGQAPGQQGWQPAGGGGPGLGGAPMDAAMMAAGGLDLLAPGAGQAAQTGMKLINRTIQYGGQLAAIGVSGLMETFGLNDTSLGQPQQSWFGRVAAGLAGATPALPSSAGQTQAPVQPQQDPNNPNHQGTGQPPGPQPGVHIDQFVQAPNRNSQQTLNDLAFKGYESGGRR